MTDDAVRLPPAVLLERASAVVLFALGAFVWSSTAITNLALAAVLVFALARSRPHDWKAVVAQPVAPLGLALFAYIVARAVPDGAGAVLYALRGYFELVALPLLLLALRTPGPRRALLAGLFAGCIVYGLVHWAGLLHRPTAAYLEGKRISAGFNMALFAYLAFDLARRGAVPRTAYVLSAFAAATVLFAIDSRTGHVVLLALLLLAAYQAAPRRRRLPVLLGALLAFSLLAASSGPLRARVAETLTAATTQGHKPITGASSSSEVRFAIVRHSLAVAREHFGLGTGWAGYAAAFKAQIVQAGDGLEAFRPDNPHNEFLLQLGAGGLPAFVLFVLWLLAPMVRRAGGYWALADRQAACAVAAFALGCLFNSLLLDFIEAHFYVTALAWILARQEAGPDAAGAGG